MSIWTPILLKIYNYIQYREGYYRIIWQRCLERYFRAKVPISAYIFFGRPYFSNFEKYMSIIICNSYFGYGRIKKLWNVTLIQSCDFLRTFNALIQRYTLTLMRESDHLDMRIIKLLQRKVQSIFNQSYSLVVIKAMWK